MKPIFSIHAGEYLVGTHIEETYKNLNVWLPSKDAGTDLLVTDPTNSKAISLQVKFSKDFLGSLGNSLSEAVATKVKSGGWWTFKPDKIKHSKADLWVLVLYRFTRRDYDFVVIEPQELLWRYEQLGRRTGVIQSYVWVTSGKKCWETRGFVMPKIERPIALTIGRYRDYKPVRPKQKRGFDDPSQRAGRLEDVSSMFDLIGINNELSAYLADEVDQFLVGEATSLRLAMTGRD